MSSAPELSPKQAYKDALWQLKAQDYPKASELFKQAIKGIQNPPPDMWRNLGWSQYLLFEDLLSSRKPSRSLSALSQSRAAYERAEKGYLRSYKTEADAEKKDLIARRITDCRRRLIHLEGFLEYLERREAILTGGDPEAVGTERPASKLPRKQAAAPAAPASPQPEPPPSTEAAPPAATSAQLKDQVQQMVGRISSWLKPEQ